MASKKLKMKATQLPKTNEGRSEVIRLLLLAADRHEAKLKELKSAVEAGDLTLVYMIAAELVGVKSVKINDSRGETSAWC